jgi:TetR/AcrR family transcriptional regulator
LRAFIQDVEHSFALRGVERQLSSSRVHGSKCKGEQESCGKHGDSFDFVRSATVSRSILEISTVLSATDAPPAASKVYASSLIKYLMNKRAQSSEKSKQAILDAAIEEFATQGLSGARTDAIAKAAGVNIALVFYYFKNKEHLYLTVLEQIFAEMNRRVMGALDCCSSNRERILAYVQTHFDFLAESPKRPRVFLQEYLRGGGFTAKESARLLQKYVKPVHDRVGKILREGIATGEFRDVDVRHFQFSLSGLTAMYFVSADKIQQLTGVDPLSAEQLAKRRRAVSDFVAAALFSAEASAHKKPRGRGKSLE